MEFNRNKMNVVAVAKYKDITINILISADGDRYAYQGGNMGQHEIDGPSDFFKKFGKPESIEILNDNGSEFANYNFEINVG